MSDHKSTYFQKIIVRSKDRSDPNTTSSTDCSIRFQETFQGRYRINWATVPNTLYTINETNNQVYFSELTVDYTVAIPVGSYTGATLAAELKTVMDASAAVATYTISYDSITSKLTFTPSAGTLGFTWGTNTTNSAAKALGFPALDVAEAASVVAPQVVFLSCPLSLGFIIRNAGGAGYVTGGGIYETTPEEVWNPVAGAPSNKQAFKSSTKEGSIILPLLADFNVYNFTSQQDHVQWVTFKKPIRVLDIQVVDPGTNSPISLNGGEWEFHMEKPDSDQLTLPKKRRRNE